MNVDGPRSPSIPPLLFFMIVVRPPLFLLYTSGTDWMSRNRSSSAPSCALHRAVVAERERADAEARKVAEATACGVACCQSADPRPGESQQKRKKASDLAVDLMLKLAAAHHTVEEGERENDRFGCRNR